MYGGAWEASALPLSYTRAPVETYRRRPEPQQAGRNDPCRPLLANRRHSSRPIVRHRRSVITHCTVIEFLDSCDFDIIIPVTYSDFDCWRLFGEPVADKSVVFGAGVTQGS